MFVTDDGIRTILSGFLSILFSFGVTSIPNLADLPKVGR